MGIHFRVDWLNDIFTNRKVDTLHVECKQTKIKNVLPYNEDGWLVHLALLGGAIV